MQSNFGFDIKALPMASICCSPPDRVPEIWLGPVFEDGEQLIHLAKIVLDFLFLAFRR